MTYTCTVPHTVCCRVPVNACGETLDEAVVPTVTAPGSGGGVRAPAVPPAAKQPSGADVPPALSPDDDGPQPHRANKTT